MKKQFQAFTLVELIVVITILAILGTIAFISLQGYSASARDSKRISDINNIKTSLELFSLNTGKYPEPDIGYDVTYDTDVVWIQGIVGDNVTTNLSRNLNTKPTDPLTELEYTYSVIGSQTQYELLSIYESDLVSYNILNQTNAATQAYPKIDGNYNGVFVKTPKYYIPTPSIINSELEGIGIELSQSNINSQIVTGGDNIISNGTNPSSTGGLDNLIFKVFTGSLDDDNDKKDLAEIIQLTYTGSSLATTDIYKTILETPEDELVTLVNNVVLGGNLVSTSSISYLDCDFNGVTVLHTESVRAYLTATVGYGDTCVSEQRTCNDSELDGNYEFTLCTEDSALNCDGGIKLGTNATYSYSAVNHLTIITGNGTKNITNGTMAYTATIECDNGDISILSEEAGIVTCNDGWTGDNCEIVLINWNDGYKYHTIGTLITYNPANLIASDGWTYGTTDVLRTWNNGTKNRYVTGQTSTTNGLTNTNNLSSATNVGSPYNAAKFCNDLILGGKSDWYLPAKNELNTLYINKNLIGGFGFSWYRSSTENGSNTAWRSFFSSAGTLYSGYKDYAYAVRCVRSAD